MQCIGDECAPAASPGSGPEGAGPHWRLLPYLALVMAGAGLGYAAAPRNVDDASRHLAAIAPPVVMVSDLAEN